MSFVDGHFLVAVSSGSVSLPIQCFRVSVKQGDDKCVIMSQALPSFFLQSSPIKENQCVYMLLQGVYFVTGHFAVEWVTLLLHSNQ
jgi:ribosomal protein L30E